MKKNRYIRTYLQVQELCESSKSSQLLTPESRPTAVQERWISLITEESKNLLRYNQAEPPPKVHLLQHVRDAHADPTLPEEKKVCEQFVQFNIDRSKGGVFP